MQTTLLSLGIAIILALVAALIGPHVVDWNQHRAFFEAQASRALGAPVKINGSIDARLLPLPSLKLGRVEAQVGPRAGRWTARELSVEFALAPLLRGEWRATELRFVAPEVQVALDQNGKLDWSPNASFLDVDAFSIERLGIEDGRLVLGDPRTGSRLVIEHFSFNGDARSLTGPAKGEGGFFTDGAHHSFRLTTGRWGPEGLRVRLAITPTDRPINGEADGMLRFEDGTPLFEGALSLARAQGVSLAQGRAIANQPWRVTSRVKASPARALMEQVEFQYGPEERSLKLAGTADLRLGESPRLDAVLSARQLDLDRFAPMPDGASRIPAAVLHSLLEGFGDGLQLDMPARIGFAVESVILAGGAVQGLRGDLLGDKGQWSLEDVELRAPGFAQIRASGRIDPSPTSRRFAGPVSVEATEPKALLAWLEGRPSAASLQLGPLRISGELDLGVQRVGIDRLRAEVDRTLFTGRLAYQFATAGGAPKLEAELTGPDLDIDAAAAVLQALLPGASLDRPPAEATLALDLGRLRVAGMEAQVAKAKLVLSEQGLTVERLTIADLSGSALELSGQVRGPWTAPSGVLNLRLGGARLDGIFAALQRVVPELDKARAFAARLNPPDLRATIELQGNAETGAGAQSARVRIEGKTGPMRVLMTGQMRGQPASWQAAELVFDGQVDAEDGRALAQLVTLERAAAVRAGPGSLRWKVSGALNQELRGEVNFQAPGIEITARGTGKAFDSPSARVDLAVKAEDAPVLRGVARRGGTATPLAFTSQALAALDRVELQALRGKVADVPFHGRLTVALTAPLRFEGSIEAESIDALGLMAAFAGMPAGNAAQTAVQPWSTAPFEDSPLGEATGAIHLKARNAQLTPTLQVRGFETLLRFAPHEAAFADIKGAIAGGRLTGSVIFSHVPAGLGAELQLALTDGELAGLLGGSGVSLKGRTSIQLEAKGSGRNLSFLVGTLAGAGTLSLENLELPRLNPKVFEAAIRATDDGAAIDPVKMRGLVERELDKAGLRLRQLDTSLALTAGQLRLATLAARGEGADLGLSASIDLPQWLLDARATLVGPATPDSPSVGQPEIYIGFKGQPAAPARSVDVSALVGWLTLRSVEQHAKRVETLDQQRRANEAGQSPEPPASPVAPAPGTPATPPTPAPSTAAAPASGGAPDTPSRAQQTPSRSAPASASQGTREPRRPRHRPTPPAANQGPRRAAQTPPTQAAPALPPPLDVRPLPGPRRPGATGRVGSAPTLRPERDGALRPPLDVPFAR